MENRYKALVEAHKKANPSMKPQKQLQDAQQLWKNLKKDPNAYDQNMLELKTKASKIDARNLGFWTNLGKSNSKISGKNDSSNASNIDPKPSTFFGNTETQREIENKVSFGIKEFWLTVMRHFLINFYILFLGKR